MLIIWFADFQLYRVTLISVTCDTPPVSTAQNLLFSGKISKLPTLSSRNKFQGFPSTSRPTVHCSGWEQESLPYYILQKLDMTGLDILQIYLHFLPLRAIKELFYHARENRAKAALVYIK